MKKLPTAKETYLNVTGCVLFSGDKPNIEKAMIEFAKLQVEAALKEASENAEIIGFEIPNGLGAVRWDINKKSILNSYPLKNIK